MMKNSHLGLLSSRILFDSLSLSLSLFPLHVGLSVCYLHTLLWIIMCVKFNKYKYKYVCIYDVMSDE